MISTCWSDKREQRWDARAMCHQLLTSSIQILDIEPGIQRASVNGNVD